ncbi:MAG: sel1 repeat family protein [Hyphomicrobiales bacterium]|nr:sel1 repeat family protein [Hyphomicrobiales bacterium]
MRRFAKIAGVALLFLAFVSGNAVAAADSRGGRVANPATDVNPQRYGSEPADAAFGAYQRGLYITALHLALPRAEKGDAAAQTLAAEIYARGLGVPRDEKKAAELYGKAAAQGVAAAEFQYALYLMEGRVVPKDEKQAAELMQAAADAGNRLAAFNYAQMLLEKDDSAKGMEKAYDYYGKAAEAGLADAQYAMSQAFANGIGGKLRNDEEARRWLLLAAHQNYDTAELELGTWLVEGRGGPADLEGGFRWLKQAAEGGNVAAENRLAKLYLNGIGTKADKVEAGAWYVLARRAGLSDPQMDIFYSGLSADEQKQAIERANKLR